MRNLKAGTAKTPILIGTQKTHGAAKTNIFKVFGSCSYFAIGVKRSGFFV